MASITSTIQILYNTAKQLINFLLFAGMCLIAANRNLDSRKRCGLCGTLHYYWACIMQEQKAYEWKIYSPSQADATAWTSPINISCSQRVGTLESYNLLPPVLHWIYVVFMALTKSIWWRLVLDILLKKTHCLIANNTSF